MKISELNAGQGNVNIEGVITEIGEKRSINKFGKTLFVTNGVLQDDSGSIKLTLWNDDASRFKQGDRIKITNGYVGEFQGEKQITSGKFGTIEKVLDSSKLGEGDENSDKESFDVSNGEEISSSKPKDSKKKPKKDEPSEKIDEEIF